MQRNVAGTTAGAGEFDRTLLLSPSQDLAGWAGKVVGRTVLTTIAFTCVAAVLLIFVFIMREAWPFLTQRGLADIFTSTKWNPQGVKLTPDAADLTYQFGSLALFYGSLAVTVIALVIAVPLAIASAVFLSDIVPFGWRQVIKPVVEMLAAIPSVAYGFFAVLVVTPWLQDTFGMSTGKNTLNAGVILAVMALPTIVSIAEDSLTAIGRELREGAYALGATRTEVVTRVIIPAAHSGIFAAIILGMMRAIGETMVVWMAAGNASQIPSPWWDLTASVRTLTATIAGDMPETAQGSLHYHALFLLGFFLLAITFVLNMTSEYFLKRAKRVARGTAK